MIPKNIIIKNYKSYGDTETKIDLTGNSVKLIYGNIGAGKTTFVDGIIWCLYGESLVNVDEVINRKNKKNCKVEFNFSIREDDYSVIRYRKHDIHGDELIIFKNNKNISPVKKRDSQELINAIVGMNHKAMISSVMFSSEIYISFLRVREAKRLEIFDSVLNMNVFKKWYDATRARKAPIEEEYNTSSSLIDRLNFGRDTVLQNIDEYKSRAKNQLVSLKTSKEKLLEEISTLKKDLVNLREIDVEKELSLAENYQEVQRINAPIKKQLLDLEAQLKDTTNSIHKISLEYNEVKKRVEDLSNIDVIEEKRKIKVDEKNKEIRQKIKDLKNEYIDERALEEARILKEGELISLTKKLEEISKNVCFTCGQEIDKEITENLTKDLKSREVELNSEIDKLVIEKEKAEKTNEAVSLKLRDLASSIEEVYNVLSFEEVQNISENVNKLKSDLEWQEKSIDSLTKTQNDTSSKINELEKELKEEVSPSKYSTDFLNNLKENISKKESEIEEKETNIKIINEKAKGVYDKSYVEELEAKIKEIDITIESEEKIKKKKQEDLLYHNYLMKALSNKDYGIKKYIISKMIDEFNKNINKYIPLFFERDIRVEFDKNLKDTIYENKQEVSFNSFSSGEKSLLDISIAFSLYILVKNFFSSDIRFLVFDEILDRNLDTEGLESILQVINELAKDNSIMVISHRSELQESFDRRIRVYKEDGFSKVEIT